MRKGGHNFKCPPFNLEGDSVIIFFLYVCIISACVFVISSIYLRANEFYEWKFPVVKKVSGIVALAALAMIIVTYTVSNIHIERKEKEQNDMFIMAYSMYDLYDSKYLSVIGKSADKKLFSYNTPGSPEIYFARAIRLDSQINIDLNNIRDRDEETLRKWFGSTDVDINYVYCRNLNKDLDKDEYKFELYYIDTDARNTAREDYRSYINETYPELDEKTRESMAKSLLSQADADRQFEVSEIFEVKADYNGNAIITDDMRAFVSGDYRGRTEKVYEGDNIENKGENTIVYEEVVPVE